MTALNWRKLARAGVLSLALGACTTTPTPQLVATDVPTAWQGPLAETAQTWPDRLWWQQFANDELSRLIDQVEAQNFDLENNRRNLQAAQISLTEAGFDLLPTPLLRIGTGASYSESRIDGQSSSNSPSTPITLSGSLSYTNIISKPVRYEGALADYRSRVAAAADLALNTLGTASSAYFRILLIRDQIEAAQQNLENAEAIARIAQAKVEAGTATPIDALQQRIAVERQRNNLRNLHQSDLAARAALALLLGRSVQGFDVAGQSLDNIMVPEVRPGLPSELLNRRPDLVQAEADLRRARVNVDLARLTYFPDISLTAAANAASTSLSELVTSPDLGLNLTAELFATLLDNGRRGRDLEQARLSLENGLANYRKAVIGAFNEIEVALGNIALLEALTLVAQEDLARAEEAFRIAQVRYREGVGDFQTVLTAQNTLYEVRNSYLDTKLARLNAMVGFYQALGGGWTTETL